MSHNTRHNLRAALALTMIASSMAFVSLFPERIGTVSRAKWNKCSILPVATSIMTLRQTRREPERSSIIIGDLGDSWIWESKSAQLVANLKEMVEVARLHYSARRQMKQDRLDHARMLYKRAVEVGRNRYARTFLLWALLEQRSGRIEDARRVFRMGVENHPSAACLVQAWGLMESKLGTARRAHLLLQRTTVLNPDSAVMRWKRVQQIAEQSKKLVNENGDVISPVWVGKRHAHFIDLSLRDKNPGAWVSQELERLELGHAMECLSIVRVRSSWR